MLVKFLKPLGIVTLAAVASVPAFSQAAAQPSQTPATGQSTPPASGQTTPAAGQSGSAASGSAASGQTAGAPAGAKEKKVKDAQEYEIYVNVTKATDPTQRLQYLDQWKQKYPETDYKQERMLYYLDAYRQLNKGPELLAAARELVNNYPNDITGLYWLNTLIPVQPNAGTDQALIAEADKAGNSLLSTINVALAPDKKPATTSDADWAKGRKDMEALAHKTLGWSAMVKKNNEEAEKHLRESLNGNPNSGEVLYWLATTLYAEKKVPEALFYFARTATYDGPGALQPAGRKPVDDYLTKAYTGYHGDTSGLAELRTLAKTSPTAPADIDTRIPSVVAVHNQKMAQEDAMLKANPQLANWKNLKANLQSDQSATIFEQMKGAKLPDKYLKGKVVSATAKEVQVGIENPTVPEVTLAFESPVKAEPGADVEFTGVAQNFTKEPFMLTLAAEKGDVTGITASGPAKAKPAAAKRRPAARRR